MKRWILLNLLSTFALAQTLTLKEIETKLWQTHPFYAAQQEKIQAHDTSVHGDYAQDPFVLSTTAAKAKPDGDDSAFEYSLGLSKTLPLGNQRTKQLEIAHLEHEAHLFEMQQDQIAFFYEVATRYHDSCLADEEVMRFAKQLKAFETLYTKKQKAYRYGDISKKDLLQLKIEKTNLKQEFKTLSTKAKILRKNLLSMLQEQDKGQVLSCQDLYPFTFKVDKKSIFTLTNKQYLSQIKAASSRQKLYKRNFETIDLSLGYDKEIDTQRYGVGFALPLSFSSSKDEYKKLSALHQEKYLKLQHKMALMQKEQRFEALKETLENEKNIVTQTRQNLSEYEQDLLPLIEKSYQLGESSLLEYLLGKQKLWQLQKELIEHKKHYYKTLFALYTIAQIKETK